VFSTPTVAGEVVLIGSCAGTFYAFDKRTGQARWSYNIHQDGNQTSFHGNPLITEQLILIGTDKSCASDGIGHIYAFNKGTGAVRWKYRTSGTPTDIALLRSTVYAASFRGELVALDIADGHLLWKFSTGSLNPDCQMPSSPVIVGDRVFYAGLDGVLYSFDGVSGKLRWKHDLGKRITTKLSVVDNSLYLGTSASRLLRISAEDGQIQSEFSVPAIPEGRILVGGSVLYVLLEDGHAGYFISTDINLSHILWTQKAEREWSSEWPRLWNRMLLVGNCRGEFTAFRSSDGAPQWSDKLKGCIRSIGTDGDAGDIFIGVQEGTVYAYSPPQIHNQPQGK
jgi:outer membrane protein assembly factor BamB